MQPPPDAADLLAVIAEVLDGEVVPILDGPTQHHARVAASLAAIVERELRLGPESERRERAALTELLDADPATEVAELRADLADRVRAGWADAPDVAARVWQVLMDSVRADLAIARPGHDRWEGD